MRFVLIKNVRFFKKDKLIYVKLIKLNHSKDFNNFKWLVFQQFITN